MSKKLLGLLCILGCVVAPFGAFAGGDEEGWFSDPALLCEAFTSASSPAENGYTMFDWTCHTHSDVCQEYRDMDIQLDDGGAYVTTCANGTVEQLERYGMVYEHGQMDVAGPCYMNYWGATYRCKRGYYGNPTSCNSTCKLAPKNSTISSDGRSYTCNSGYTKLTVNGTASCCATSWTTLSRKYKYRACWPEGQTKSVGLYTCNEAQSYYATNNFNPASVTCTWNNSTNKASSCSGCTQCTTGTSYGDGTGTGVQIVYNTTKSTSTHSLYGTYVTACTKSVSSYRCKGGYYGSPTGSAGTCNPCPTTTSTGLTTVRGTYDNDAWTTGTSAAGATSKTQCYANSGYTDLGDEMITIYNDGTGNFYWGSNDDVQYNCYYTN